MDELTDSKLYLDTVVFCIGLVDDINSMLSDVCWRCEDSILWCPCISEDSMLLARSIKHGLN